ncbi:response regulator transcription factor [Corticicoccus populi]|uniref:Response regulator n=1 Tax=Corticicoccus populi TaxID=1812821 RepID=A0ABW5WWC4_9STAP
MNILLIDDEQLELDQLEYLLEPYLKNHQIFQANDVTEALNVLENHKIHLALVDIHLPGTSGLELAKQLKKSGNTKVIIVTAFQSFDYAQQALRIKVDNYITKPIVEAELIEVVMPYLKDVPYSPIILQVIDIIQERYHTKLTLNKIADEIHVNHAHLSRKFNDEVGISFPDYLNDYRIEAAKKLLRGNSSIAIIAEECGFSGQHYFSVLFKKKVGKTPSEFKKESQNQ